MASVGSPVVRRIIEVAQGPDRAEDLLASVGLSADAPPTTWVGESVEVDAYYGLLERVAAGDDGLPFRYAAALHPDDLGALGLALKTAPTFRDSLTRLVRYILVLSDSLEYELCPEPGGAAFALTGRPHHRRGAALANECALAAVVSTGRRIVGAEITPRRVELRHPDPVDGDRAHQTFFGCPVLFGADTDAVHWDDETLARPTLLGDAGLSSYLLTQLDELRDRAAERSVVLDVAAAVTDALPDGAPSRARVARRLGMSERTLQRRLAEDGETFQSVVTRARREAAESLLRSGSSSLAEVAFLTGFSDQTAFSRAFKRWTGETPAGFRAAPR